MCLVCIGYCVCVLSVLCVSGVSGVVCLVSCVSCVHRVFVGSIPAEYAALRVKLACGLHAHIKAL